MSRLEELPPTQEVAKEEKDALDKTNATGHETPADESTDKSGVAEMAKISAAEGTEDPADKSGSSPVAPETELADTPDAIPSAPEPPADECTGKCSFLRARVVMSVMAFFGVVVVFLMKMNLQLVLDAMINTGMEISSDENRVPCPEGEAADAKWDQAGEFDWDKKTRKLLLSMALCGSVVGHLIGGRLADTLGGKRVFGCGVLLSALFLMLNPYLARLQLEALMAARVLEGLSQGVALPAVNAMLVRWIPRTERSFVAAFIYSGIHLGYIGGMAATSWILDNHVWGGWPTSFYVFGALGAIWAGIWLMLVYDLPAEHPRISKAELEHIRQNTDTDSLTVSKNFPSKVLMSLPVFALVVVHCGTNFGFLMITSQLPMFWKGLPSHSFNENALLVASPYIGAAIVSMICACGTDCIVYRRNVHITAARKIAQAFGSIGPAIGVFVAAGMGCDHFWIKLGLQGAICLAGFSSFGSAVVPVDIAPSFAGTVTGYVRAVGEIVGLLVYLVASEIPGPSHFDRWAEMLFLTGAIYVCSYLVYLALGSSDIQSWGIELFVDEMHTKHLEMYDAVPTEDTDTAAVAPSEETCLSEKTPAKEGEIAPVDKNTQEVSGRADDMQCSKQATERVGGDK